MGGAHPRYWREAIVPIRTPSGRPIRIGPTVSTGEEMLPILAAGEDVSPVYVTPPATTPDPTRFTCPFATRRRCAGHSSGAPQQRTTSSATSPRLPATSANSNSERGHRTSAPVLTEHIMSSSMSSPSSRTRTSLGRSHRRPRGRRRSPRVRRRRRARGTGSESHTPTSPHSPRPGGTHRARGPGTRGRVPHARRCPVGPGRSDAPAHRSGEQGAVPSDAGSDAPGRVARSLINQCAQEKTDPERQLTAWEALKATGQRLGGLRTRVMSCRADRAGFRRRRRQVHRRTPSARSWPSPAPGWCRTPAGRSPW